MDDFIISPLPHRVASRLLTAGFLLGPVVLTLRPFSKTAVAAVTLLNAFSGFALRKLIVFSIELRMFSVDMAISPMMG
jgi:hypothetical protein